MRVRERLRQMLAAVEREGELTVQDACKRFGASPATIRRDFQKLHQRGEVEKTWGGIQLRTRSFNLMPPYPEREVRQTRAKQLIANAAATLVAEGDVVFIDGGTTTFHLAAGLAHRRVRIVTNSIGVAREIERLRRGRVGAEVYLAGGMLFPNSELLVGYQTLRTLADYHAQWCFLSASGLDEEGPSNHDERVVEVERAMIAGADQLALLVDHSKVGIRSMVAICPMTDLDVWVTDRMPEQESISEALKKNSVRVMPTDLTG
ncbi:MAG: DeoR/GlpR family DNA-binding transcription regulator [Candidatus Methylacidiphilales bacterium]